MKCFFVIALGFFAFPWMARAANVGIGTTAPATLLDVYGAQGSITAALSTYGLLDVRDSTAMAVNVGGVITLGGQYISTPLYTAFAAIKGAKNSATGGNADGYMAFYTPPTTGILAERMRIDSAGNVGIGTTSPGSNFVVTGTSNVTTSETTPLLIGGTAASSTLTLESTSGSGTTDAILFKLASQSEKMRITTAGNVGIGTTAPANRLTVSAPDQDGISVLSAGTARLDFTPSAGGGAVVNNSAATGTFFNQNNTTMMTLTGAGNVGIATTAPAYTLHVVGTAGLSTGTAWTNASDIRLKDIHGDYEYGLEEILKLHTVRFNYKKDNPLKLPSDKPMTGFIAQEVQKVIPDAISMNKNGYLELNADPIHWAVVNAVKELHGLYQELKSLLDAVYERLVALEKATTSLTAESTAKDQRIDKLEQENNQLRQENTAVKTYLCGKDPAAGFCH